MIYWAWFAVVQLVSLLAAVLGWVVLIPFCLLQAWHAGSCKTGSFVSIKDGRSIDAWSWQPLNWVYGNPEDGVSGQRAVLISGAAYLPGAWAPWRAYLWSAWRNSADNLKYVFAWDMDDSAPYKSGQFSIFGKVFTYGMGWKVESGHYNVPVLSVKPV